jgi:serine/threonine protein phosphatase PrpC
MAAGSDANGVADFTVHFALSSDRGTERKQNEDACGSYAESPTHVLVTVADGVSGEEGGEIASQTAIDVTIRAYTASPPSWGPAKRLYRAAQQANIEIHDRALVVTELHRMSTTLTAIVVDGGTLYAAHVGDSRLYLIRSGAIVQKTKDHTVAADRQRMGLLSAKRAKYHPERSTLTRSVGRELIVAVDRISFPLVGDDVLLVCSDGLYNVLEDDELREAATAADPALACQAMIRTANERGTPDNLTVAVVRVTGAVPGRDLSGWRARLGRLVGR